MEAEGRKLIWRDAVPYVAGLSALGQQVSEQVADLLLRMGDLVVPVKAGSDLSGWAGD